MAQCEDEGSLRELAAYNLDADEAGKIEADGRGLAASLEVRPQEPDGLPVRVGEGDAEGVAVSVQFGVHAQPRI